MIDVWQLRCEGAVRNLMVAAVLVTAACSGVDTETIATETSTLARSDLRRRPWLMSGHRR